MVCNISISILGEIDQKSTNY